MLQGLHKRTGLMKVDADWLLQKVYLNFGSDHKVCLNTGSDQKVPGLPKHRVRPKSTGSA
jgi:hypothetical protein